MQQYGHIIGIYRRRRRSIGRGGKEGGGRGRRKKKVEKKQGRKDVLGNQGGMVATNEDEKGAVTVE